MEIIINGILYDTDIAELIAFEWDGSYLESGGGYLYKMPQGDYFSYIVREDKEPIVEPLTIEEAILFYENSAEQEVGFVDAFGIDPEEE